MSRSIFIARCEPCARSCPAQSIQTHRSARYTLLAERSIFRCKRLETKISLRNHLRLWRAPFTIDGEYVWVGQISRDIGIKFTTQSWYLTTHRISPEVDHDRYYLLQDLAVTGEVARFGFASGVGVSTAADPRTNLAGDPYLTDGLRLVV